MSPFSEISFEADPDPLLDLLSLRNFPLSSYSTALQRWELLKAFGSDAELFTDIFKLHFLSSTCLENSIM